jgi:hypothetical protein
MKASITVKLVSVLAVVALLASCAAEQAQPAQTTEWGTVERPIEWGYSDNPASFDSEFEYTFYKLPKSGEAENVPWTGNYWPTYRDNINYRWNGASSDSPAKKYENAFGRSGLEDRVSKTYGIDSVTTYGLSECKKNVDCDSDKGETCAKRTGKDSGYCIPTWFGICHAWAPATIMEPEPKHNVIHNGVEFKVNDIKALVSLGYTAGVSVDFISLRCNKNDDDDKINYNEFGIPDGTNPECADTNAGTFHVVVTNMLGIQKKAFIEDRTFDDEVWNQPVRSFEVTSAKWVSTKTANELVGAADGGYDYQFNDNSSSYRHVKMKLNYITESPQSLDGHLGNIIDYYTNTDHYEYVLELDSSGKIIGGEWVGKSKKDHPDFLWVPRTKKSIEIAKDDSFTPGTGISWDDVKMLLDKSQDSQEPVVSTGFDWGDGCVGGDGTFNTYVEKNAVIDVGELAVDRHGIVINLTSSEDVDVQLIDKETGHQIIAWPSGDLNGAGEECTTYHGVEYCYSGYNGDGSNLGHEWIKVNGATNRPLIMKTFGYKSGDALVDYKWDAPSAGACNDSGSGTFSQAIEKNATVDVGVIPSGKKNLAVTLTCSTDVDIQIYDGNVAIVMWPSGILSGPGKQTTTYEGMKITYSGYNGDGTNYGHEYITIEGTVSKDLTMKAFGYKAGSAKVDYAWGLSDTAIAAYGSDSGDPPEFFDDSDF